ncbi:pilus assembly protein PilX [Psychrobacter sp. AOP22-C1-22]|uniref:pilus assembly protein PilX n=1 Tax=unclassified Psychrobacter TaxID=196806 RepID=UPI0017878910|nr:MULTISPECIES: pilus assembly protein PilX [unclassified Psychrobacter]MBE0408011.1 pilus assembly protein PilX [Psychrobacter sp. FME6]MBE0446264.1 pilus assembly protein PilX [Psychrobacter sp. FME5]
MPSSRHLSGLTIIDIRSAVVYRESEQGATLIVVLLFLVLIMLAGAIAVRQSNTDLKVATSDQINTILLQSSDSGNQKLENMINGDPASEQYKDVTSSAGVFGHFLLDDKNTNNEFIYCFNPRTQKYLTANATIRDPSGGYWSGLDKGICNYKSADGYTSNRQTIVTQMSVTTTPPDPNAEAFSQMVIGKEVEDRTSKRFKFDIRATSALPAYHEPKDDNGSCFDNSSITAADGKNAMNDCMLAAMTPSKMLYEQVDVENVSASTTCIPFGKGSGSLDRKCVLASP